MSCIIRSSIEFDTNDLSFTAKKKVNDFWYYYLDVSGTNIANKISQRGSLLYKISECCLSSKYLPLWKEKESMYSIRDDLDLIDNESICFSREYCDCKSKITEESFRGIMLLDDLSVFEIKASVVGMYRDYEKTGNLPIILSSNYVDDIYNTSYEGKDFTSLEGYLSTRNEFVL